MLFHQIISSSISFKFDMYIYICLCVCVCSKIEDNIGDQAGCMVPMLAAAMHLYSLPQELSEGEKQREKETDYDND